MFKKKVALESFHRQKALPQRDRGIRKVRSLRRWPRHSEGWLILHWTMKNGDDSWCLFEREYHGMWYIYIYVYINIHIYIYIPYISIYLYIYVYTHDFATNWNTSQQTKIYACIGLAMVSRLVGWPGQAKGGRGKGRPKNEAPANCLIIGI